MNDSAWVITAWDSVCTHSVGVAYSLEKAIRYCDENFKRAHGYSEEDRVWYHNGDIINIEEAPLI